MKSYFVADNFYWNPCEVCKHRKGKDTDYPCNKCKHNENAVLDNLIAIERLKEE